jgi:branched-chain amino acid transport system permease protein
VLVLVVVVGLLVPFLIASPYTMRLVDLALVYSIYALSLNVVLGYTGLINLGQSAFLGIGAYTTGIVAVQTGLPFLLCLLASVIFGAVAGLIVGVPALRIGGHYLALVTIAFALIGYVFFVNLRDLTGGYDGLNSIPAPTLGGLRFDNVFTFYYLPFIALVLVALGLRMVRTSHLGRSMVSIREDEDMARALGVRPMRTKTLAFVACSCLASLAGGLYAYLYGYVSPDSFDVVNSVLVLAMVLIGGTGSIVGSIIGAFLLTLLPEYLRFLGPWYPVVYAVVIIVVMLFLPGGLASLGGRLKAAYERRRR